MKYQRLVSLSIAALGATTSVSASPLLQRDDNAQCPPGYTASVYYITVTASATPTSSVAEWTTLHSSSTVTETTTVTPSVVAPSSTLADNTATIVPTPVVPETSPVESSLPVESSVSVEVKPSTSSAAAVEQSTVVAPVEPTVVAPTTSAVVETTVAAPTTTSKAATTTQAPIEATATQATPTKAASSSGSSEVNSGKATFYGGNVSGGTCSFTGYTLPSSLFGTALSQQRWSDAADCGACVSVTGPDGNSVKAMIVDKCPECESNHLDLFENAFTTLADKSKGVIPISWSYVPCGIETPLVLKNKEGTSQYWFSMQVVNANEPITSLEVSTDGGSTWQATTRSDYNFFENQSGFGTDSVDVRVTGQSGATIKVSGVGCQSGVEKTASGNF